MKIKQPSKKLKDLCELKCLAAAVKYFDGNQAEFARAMKTSGQNIQNWTKKGVIPPSKAMLAERVTGGVVQSRSILIENEMLELGSN